MARGGIPVAARLMALIGALRAAGDNASEGLVRQVQSLRKYQSQPFHSAGTDQRKRRKHTRSVLGGKRRKH